MINKLLMICLIAFVSCKQEKTIQKSSSINLTSQIPKGSSKLSNGYAFKNHTNVKGKKAKPNQIVTIDFHIINDLKEVLSDSRTAGVRPTVKIPTHLHADSKRNPLLSLIKTMTEGDSATVYVPVDSLSNPPRKFLTSENVEYHVKLLKIEDETTYMDRIGSEQKKLKEESLSEARSAFEEYKAGRLEKDLIEKDHNVRVAIATKGNGEFPKYEDAVSVNYYGFFEDGSSFDSSYKVGKPYTFVLGRGSVIEGWDIGIPSVDIGGTAILDVPFPMAYGKAGNSVIPPRTKLFFWVKVEEIQKPTIK